MVENVNRVGHGYDGANNYRTGQRYACVKVNLVEQVNVGANNFPVGHRYVDIP